MSSTIPPSHENPLTPFHEGAGSLHGCWCKTVTTLSTMGSPRHSVSSGEHQASLTTLGVHQENISSIVLDYCSIVDNQGHREPISRKGLHPPALPVCLHAMLWVHSCSMSCAGQPGLSSFALSAGTSSVGPHRASQRRKLDPQVFLNSNLESWRTYCGPHLRNVILHSLNFCVNLRLNLPFLRLHCATVQYWTETEVCSVIFQKSSYQLESRVSWSLSIEGKRMKHDPKIFGIACWTLFSERMFMNCMKLSPPC